MASIFDAFIPKVGVRIVFPDTLAPGGGFKEFPIDVTTAINTSLTASVTQFPVEGRETISDHVQPQPLSMSIEGFISESPSSQLLSVVSSIVAGVVGSANLPGLTGTFAAAAAGAAVSQAFSGQTPATEYASFVKLLTTRNESDVDFPKRAMIGMVRMFEQGAPFTLRTFFNDSLYNNMVMTSLSFKQTSKEGNSLAFSMGCKKINVTTTFTKDASEFRMQNPAGQSAAAKKLKDKVTKKERSLALDVFGIK